MFTLVTDAAGRRLFKAAAIYGTVTLLCLIFTAVYEAFSYGEYSWHMRLMFLIPLTGGMLTALGLMFSDARVRITRVAFNLWNSGIAVLIFACLIRGIINISGRFTDYDKYYRIAGGLLLISAVAASFISSKSRSGNFHK